MSSDQESNFPKPSVQKDVLKPKAKPTFKVDPALKAKLAAAGVNPAGAELAVNMTEEQINARRVAFAAAKAREAELEAQQERKAPDDVFYLQCPCAKALPALFFEGDKAPDLSRDIMPSFNQWFAAYRDSKDPWPRGRAPVCQVCLATENKFVECKTRQRFVCRMPRDEFDAMCAPEGGDGQ